MEKKTQEEIEAGKKRREESLRKNQFKKGTDTEAQKLGRAKCVEARREAADMRRAMRMLMNLPVKGKTKSMLETMGYSGEDLNTSNALAATLYAKAMQGDNKAMEMVLQFFFQESEDNRKTKESNARIDALAKNGVDISVNSSEEDSGVVVYLPKIEDEVDEE